MMTTVVYYERIGPKDTGVFGGLSGWIEDSTDWYKMCDMVAQLHKNASGLIDDNTVVYTNSGIYHVYGYSEKDLESYAFVKCNKRLPAREKVMSWLMKNFNVIEECWKKKK